MALRSFSSLTLRDGRKLAFREYGNGFPVIFLHGNLNSRLFAPSWSATEEDSEAAGCRVIAIDRPGYGDSCYQEHRQYKDTAMDIEQLLDHLQLAKAAVVGYSSGGPNAMACAAHIPSRLSSLGIVSSDGPYSLMGPTVMSTMFHLSSEEERTLESSDQVGLTFEMSRARAEENFKNLRQAYMSLSKEDRRELAIADLEHAAKQGLDKGPSQDALLESGAWDFTLEQVEASISGNSSKNAMLKVPCFLWHGLKDVEVPFFVGQHLAEHLPSAEAHLVDGESHSMIRRRWKEILLKVSGST